MTVVIPGLFANADRKSLGDGQLGDEKLMGPEACVVWMYEQLHEQGADVSGRQGLGAYGFLSNMTHPTLYPARQMRTWIEEGDHVESILHLDVDFLTRLASAAVVPYFNALSLLVSYMGWRSKRYEDWPARIEQVLPGAFYD